MSYPTTDPHPVGTLTSGDENYQKTTLFTTSGQIINLRNRHYHPSVCYYNKNVYYVYLDADARPKLVKSNLTGTTVTETYLDNGADYVVPSDSHFTFTIGVDRIGYVHVIGDIHNHYPTSSSGTTKVARYNGSYIMYWISDSVENISAFTFYGYDTDRIPPGYSFSYPQFHRDMNGQLYFKARVYTYAGAHYEGEVGLGIYKYDETSTSWTALGDLPSLPHGNVATYKVVFWEDNGEWWQSQPVDTTRAFYQGFYNGLSFDRDNNIHFCYAINNFTLNKQATEVVYWKVLDGETVARKADGTQISWPVRASGSTNAGDIVGADGRYYEDCWVDVDWGGNPVVAFSDYTDQTSTVPNSPPKTRIYRDGVWESAIDMTLNRIYGSGVGSGNDYILTYWALNNSTTDALLYRARRYNETGYTVNPGGELSGFDWTTFKKTGYLFLSVNDKVNQNLVKITFGNPLICDAGLDQSVTTQTTTLDGTRSFSDSGSITTYLWEQISGPNTANILTSSGSSSIVNGLITGDYVFKLTVTDSFSQTNTDTVNITANIESTTTTKANARVLL